MITSAHTEKGEPMKLTPKEKEICKKHGARDKDGYVHCDECPLVIRPYDFICYANIDGRTKEAKELKRL